MGKLPYDINTIKELSVYLTMKLKQCSCDHLLYFTMEFIELHQLSLQSMIKWLKINNVDCDCKVLTFIKRYAERQLYVVT